MTITYFAYEENTYMACTLTHVEWCLKGIWKIWGTHGCDLRSRRTVVGMCQAPVFIQLPWSTSTFESEESLTWPVCYCFRPFPFYFDCSSRLPFSSPLQIEVKNSSNLIFFFLFFVFLFGMKMFLVGLVSCFFYYESQNPISTWRASFLENKSRIDSVLGSPKLIITSICRIFTQDLAKKE